jgi:hypothetical protein
MRSGAAIYVSVLGLDHRLGWVAFGGSTSTLVSFVLHTSNTEWTYQPCAGAAVPDVASNLETLMEIIGAAIVQETLIAITGRITPFVLISRILARHALFIFLSAAILTVILLNYRKKLALMISNPNRRLQKSLRTLFWLWIIGHVTLLALIQVFVDIDEIADLKLGWLYPWNHRWQEPSPPWWML